MTVQVVHGNALDLAACGIADDSVDLIVTSPPYFGLRSYQDGGEHYAGQVGAEATPAEFVDALVAATREMVRVLKPSGSIFVNLGDKYAGSTGGGAPSASSTLRGNGHVGGGPKQQAGGGRAVGHKVTGAPTKSLVGLPWRYALRCIDDLGLILRAEIVWSKPNGLPESVTDRVRRSHETWFHFTKSPRYYANVDEVREPHVMKPQRRSGRPVDETPRQGQMRQAWSTASRDEPGPDGNPLGKLPGSVWTIPTQPLRLPPELGVQHFAAFPMEWPRRFVKAWCPPAICTACGEGRRTYRGGAEVCACTPRVSHRGQRGDWREGRTVNAQQRADDWSSPGLAVPRRPGGFGDKVPTSRGEWEYLTDGWTAPPATPAVVLDPFGGTGTTATVAHALGRDAITVDLSRDYCRVAEWRTADEGQLAKARQEPKPKPTKSRARAVTVDEEVDFATELNLLDLLNDGGAA